MNTTNGHALGVREEAVEGTAEVVDVARCCWG